MEISLAPFWLSLKLATITTFILFFLGILLVYCVYFSGKVGRPLLKAIVNLPLVLPPTVLGYYLLVFFQPEGWVGQLTEYLFSLRLVFSFPGLVVASVIFSLPFMVNPMLSAIENLPAYYQEAAFTLGKSKWTTLTKVLLPNVKSSVIVGLVMTFAHTIGEFGVILMIGGNIPGETRVASIAIYDEVETLNYAGANFYASALLVFSFIVLVCVYFYQGKKTQGVL